MKKTKELFQLFTLGEMTSISNLTYFPLISKQNGPKHQYITLKEALEKKYLTIQEVSQAGTVNTLLAINQSPYVILITDGEEVTGAKQNRVMVTAILIPAQSEIRIPVNCTERGRWSSKFENSMKDAEFVHPPTFRYHKSQSTKDNLKSFHQFMSDQGKSWAMIDEYFEAFQQRSQTSAMNDLVTKSKKEFDQLLKETHCLENQVGMMVFVNGEFYLMDYISQPSAFSILFPKLLLSYGLESKLRLKETCTPINRSKAERSLEKVIQSLEKDVKDEIETESIGLGVDYRKQTKAYEANFLFWEDELICSTIYSKAVVEIPIRRRESEDPMMIEQVRDYIQHLRRIFIDLREMLSHHDTLRLDTLSREVEQLLERLASELQSHPKVAQLIEQTLEKIHHIRRRHYPTEHLDHLLEDIEYNLNQILRLLDSSRRSRSR
ncbi:MAG: FUSC family protein [bacterium]|nr:FUSC family protein [bacterium]